MLDLNAAGYCFDVGHPASEKAGTPFYQASTRNVWRKMSSSFLVILLSQDAIVAPKTCDDAFCVTQSGMCALMGGGGKTAQADG